MRIFSIQTFLVTGIGLLLAYLGLTFWLSDDELVTVDFLNPLGETSVEEYPESGYEVRGTSLYGPGGIHTIYGVTRPSLEWSCGEYMMERDYAAIAEWGFNLVRIPLNQTYWNDNVYCDTDEFGNTIQKPYRDVVADQVAWSRTYGLDIMLDLHWVEGVAGDGVQELYPMPDLAAIPFWESLAEVYGNQPDIMFELYAEPHEVSPEVWRNGGIVPSFGYEAAGMQRLVDVIRERGVHNILLVKGLDWGFDYTDLELLDGDNIMYGAHPYGMYDYHTDLTQWYDYFGFVAEEAPLIFSEFGDDSDCSGSFDKQVLAYAQRRNMGWIAWAWYPGGCEFPSLTTTWEGDPSAVGLVIREWLATQASYQ